MIILTSSYLRSGRGFGILFILLGSTLYTYIKDLEQRKKEQIASHGRDSPALTCSTSSNLFDEKPRGISSAHNSPVLSSSSTFESVLSHDPHSRSSEISLGVNAALANSQYGSSIPSPRTPTSLLSRQTSCNVTPPDRNTLEADRTTGLWQGPDVSPKRRSSFDSRIVPPVALSYSAPPRRPGHHQQNGQSYQGPRW